MKKEVGITEEIKQLLMECEGKKFTEDEIAIKLRKIQDANSIVKITSEEINKKNKEFWNKLNNERR